MSSSSFITPSVIADVLLDQSIQELDEIRKQLGAPSKVALCPPKEVVKVVVKEVEKPTYQKEWERAKEEIAELKKRKREEEERLLQEYNASLKEKKQEYDASLARIREVEGDRVTVANQKARKCEEELTSLKERVKSLSLKENVLSQVEKKRDTLEESLRKKEEELKQLEQKRDKEEKKFQEEMEALKKKQQEALRQFKIQYGTQQQETVRLAVQQKEKEVRTPLEEEIKRLEGELAALRKREQECQESLTKCTESEKEKVEQLKESKGELGKQIQEKQETIELLRDQIKKETAAITQLKQQHQKSRKELEKQRDKWRNDYILELEEKKRETAKLERQLEARKKEAEASKEKELNTQDRLRQCEKKNQALSQENRELLKELEEAREKISEQTNELERLREAESDCEQLKEMIRNKSTEELGIPFETGDTAEAQLSRWVMKAKQWREEGKEKEKAYNDLSDLVVTTLPPPYQRSLGVSRSNAETVIKDVASERDALLKEAGTNSLNSTLEKWKNMWNVFDLVPGNNAEEKRDNVRELMRLKTQFFRGIARLAINPKVEEAVQVKEDAEAAFKLLDEVRSMQTELLSTTGTKTRKGLLKYINLNQEGQLKVLRERLRLSQNQVMRQKKELKDCETRLRRVPKPRPPEPKKVEETPKDKAFNVVYEEKFQTVGRTYYYADYLKGSKSDQLDKLTQLYNGLLRLFKERIKTRKQFAPQFNRKLGKMKEKAEEGKLEDALQIWFALVWTAADEKLFQPPPITEDEETQLLEWARNIAKRPSFVPRR